MHKEEKNVLYVINSAYRYYRI